MEKEKAFRTFLILTLVSGVLVFVAEYRNDVIWSYVLLICQIGSLVCLAYFSDIIKLKKIKHR